MTSRRTQFDLHLCWSPTQTGALQKNITTTDIPNTCTPVNLHSVLSATKTATFANGEMSLHLNASTCSMQLHVRKFNLSWEKCNTIKKKVFTVLWRRLISTATRKFLPRNKESYSDQKYMPHWHTAPSERGHSTPVYVWVRCLWQVI
jgi:hypothetical protein